MSLKNFTRRSFFRFVATALATVACVGLLAGCGSDSNKPSRDGDGSLTNIDVDTDVTLEKNDPLTFTIEVTNQAKNEIAITPDLFSVVVYDSEKDESFAYSGSSYLTINSTNDLYVIATDEKAKLTLTVTGVSATKSDDEVTLRYRPRSSYENIFSSWYYTGSDLTDID